MSHFTVQRYTASAPSSLPSSLPCHPPFPAFFRSLLWQLSISSQVRVLPVDRLINLLAYSHDASYSEIAEKLPMFLLLSALRHELESVPVLIGDHSVRGRGKRGRGSGGG